MNPTGTATYNEKLGNYNLNLDDGRTYFNCSYAELKEKVDSGMVESISIYHKTLVEVLTAE
jgi:hypothetical protein